MAGLLPGRHGARGGPVGGFILVVLLEFRGADFQRPFFFAMKQMIRFAFSALLACAIAFGSAPKTTPARTVKKPSHPQTKTSRQKAGTHAKTASAPRRSSYYTAKARARRGSRAGYRHAGAPVAEATTWRNRQMAPTPDRYREIQGALASKGYLKSAPTGSWDAESQDALRRFQADQKFDQTGKLDSRSLISLGLGPPKPAQTVEMPPAPAPVPDK